MTLAHFFRNDFVTYPVEGISYDEKKFPLMMGTSYDPEVEKHHPLTPFGEKLVWNMFDLGIVVDLTHTNPTARKRVFELNKKFNNEKNAKRPVIFSHSGVQSLFNPSIKYVNYKYYNASDEEIWEIKECNGVIGVIPENFWLVGCDTHLSDVRTSSYRKGIKFMLETIDYIYQQTGSYDNIAIGSDFDGLADDPDDLYTPSQFGNLIHGMSEHGIPFEDIKKITHLNALRVLKDGWVTAKT